MWQRHCSTELKKTRWGVISMEEKTNDKDTKTLKRGKRTYFFDLKEASNGNKYLRITESRFVKEGEARKRNTFTLFKDDIEGFVQTIQEVAESLDKGI